MNRMRDWSSSWWCRNAIDVNIPHLNARNAWHIAQPAHSLDPHYRVTDSVVRGLEKWIRIESAGERQYDQVSMCHSFEDCWRLRLSSWETRSMKMRRNPMKYVPNTKLERRPSSLKLTLGKLGNIQHLHYSDLLNWTRSSIKHRSSTFLSKPSSTRSNRPLSTRPNECLFWRHPQARTNLVDLA